MFNPKKLLQGRYRRTALQIYYEDLYEKDQFKKVKTGFQNMVRGFSTASFMLETDNTSPKDILKKLDNIEDGDKDALFEQIKRFFKYCLQTDVEKALENTSYGEK